MSSAKQRDTRSRLTFASPSSVACCDVGCQNYLETSPAHCLSQMLHKTFSISVLKLPASQTGSFQHNIVEQTAAGLPQGAAAPCATGRLRFTARGAQGGLSFHLGDAQRGVTFPMAGGASPPTSPGCCSRCVQQSCSEPPGRATQTASPSPPGLCRAVGPRRAAAAGAPEAPLLLCISLAAAVPSALFPPPPAGCVPGVAAAVAPLPLASGSAQLWVLRAGCHPRRPRTGAHVGLCPVLRAPW